jgi:hypothetical protein
VFIPELLFPADKTINQIARPVISKCYRQPDGKFAIEFTAQADGMYCMQYSNDLTHWHTVPLATSAGNMHWVDADSNAMNRFYRLVYLP